MEKFVLTLALAVASIAFVGGQAHAQSTRRVPERNYPDASSSSGEDRDERMGTPALEMTHRALIARAEAEHKQNIKRANEGAALALTVQQAFQQNHALSAAQVKNLEQIEKLARRIRSYAGGSDDGAAVEELPSNLDEALKRLSSVATQLQQEVEKTSRQVVSAKIITAANNLIALARHARTLAR